MSNRLHRLFGLLAGVFALHEAEEWNLVEWLGLHFTPEPGFSDQGARTLLVLFTALAVSFTIVSLRFLSQRAALMVLLPLYLTVVLGNSLTHLFWVAYFGGYAPGAVTSLVLVPLAVRLARLCLRERLAPRAYVWGLLVSSLLQPFGAARAGSSLSAAQIWLQGVGEGLAGWLWNAV